MQAQEAMTASKPGVLRYRTLARLQWQNKGDMGSHRQDLFCIPSQTFTESQGSVSDETPKNRQKSLLQLVQTIPSTSLFLHLFLLILN